MMKRVFLALAAALTVAVCNAQIPDVKVENDKGEQISAASLLDEGKPVIISFWSTTCKPCITELNAINDQLEEWLSEADFRMVAVCADDSRSSSKARSMVSGNGWEFTVLYDKNQDLKRALNVSLLPQTFIFDASGKMVYSHTGYIPGSEVQLLEKILEIE